MENFELRNAYVHSAANAGPGDVTPGVELEKDVDLLNDLIATNRGIASVYQTAADHLESETYEDMLRDTAIEHDSFAADLSNLVVRLSGSPATGADMGSLAKRAWVTLKAVLTEGDAPILAAVTQDAQNVLEAYGEALSADLPDDVRDVIQRHTRQARLTYEKLLPLKAAYNDS